jgi:hypothetical protein
MRKELVKNLKARLRKKPLTAQVDFGKTIDAAGKNRCFLSV